MRYTGLRPGEKLYEELLATGENSLPTPHPKLRIARVRSENRVWADALVSWLQRSSQLPAAEIRRQLARWVPEDHSGSSWRSAMNLPPLRAWNNYRLWRASGDVSRRMSDIHTGPFQGPLPIGRSSNPAVAVTHCEAARGTE